MITYDTLEMNAAGFAREKHNKQRRKYSANHFLPLYITHPAATADIVRSVNHTEEMLAAMWLHDTVEDCGVLPILIEDNFGPEVRRLVESLTDVAQKSDGNRAARVAKNREHSAAGDAASQTLKMADVIHNSYRVHIVAPDFAKTYWAEKQALASVLTKADPKLREFYSKMKGDNTDDFRYEHACPTTLYLAMG